MTVPVQTAPAPDRVEELVGAVQELQAAMDGAGDALVRGLAEELVAAVIRMYGSGLERLLATVAAAGDTGAQIIAALTEDPLITTLLFIHDLHPVPLEDRVQAALDSVRPYMASHGGNVELLGVEAGVARIHLRGSCSDCSASAVTLELAIKQALEAHAPDLEGLEVEGVAPQTVGRAGLPMLTGAHGSGMELPVVMAGPPRERTRAGGSGGGSAGGSADPGPGTAAGPGAWIELASDQRPPGDTVLGATVGDTALVVADVDGTLLAYRDVCAGCGAPIHDGALTDGTLTCPHCRRAFFLPRAGRSMDDDQLQLEPVPLLIEAGCVRVALAR
ncbi:NifU family protein [Conexibacter sp. DBS9H8]|uniref:NifU family protein n=1 Tax=Conexibacter sp. DBS9H8 TaxID=2937801 RepID=UPI00200FA04F|nr:NifU family protein [Conexibacter sp. DBS9H8]